MLLQLLTNKPFQFLEDQRFRHYGSRDRFFAVYRADIVIVPVLASLQSLPGNDVIHHDRFDKSFSSLPDNLLH